MEFHTALNQNVVGHSVEGDKGCLGHCIKPISLIFKVCGIKSIMLKTFFFHIRKRHNKTDICAHTFKPFPNDKIWLSWDDVSLNILSQRKWSYKYLQIHNATLNYLQMGSLTIYRNILNLNFYWIKQYNKYLSRLFRRIYVSPDQVGQHSIMNRQMMMMLACCKFELLLFNNNLNTNCKNLSKSALVSSDWGVAAVLLGWETRIPGVKLNCLTWWPYTISPSKLGIRANQNWWVVRTLTSQPGGQPASS